MERSKDTGAAQQVRGTSQEDLEVAMGAMRRCQHGASTGEWQPFPDALADDVASYAPVPGFYEYGDGKERAVELFVHPQGATRTTLTVKNVLADGNEVGFGIGAEGEIDGNPYPNWLSAVFVVEGGKVARSREYAAGTGYGGLKTAREAFDYLDGRG
jgi:hypothetical protein